MININKDFEIKYTNVRDLDDNQYIINSQIISDEEKHDLYIVGDKNPQDIDIWNISFLIVEEKTGTAEVGHDVINIDEDNRSYYSIVQKYEDIKSNAHKFIKLFLKSSLAESIKLPLPILTKLVNRAYNDVAFKNIRDNRPVLGYSKYNVELDDWNRNISININNNDITYKHKIIDFNEILDPIKIIGELDKAIENVKEGSKEKGRRKAKEELRNWLECGEAKVVI